MASLQVQHIFYFVIIATVTSVNAFYSQEVENVRALTKLLSVPQKPERFVLDSKFPQNDAPVLTKFNFKSCGKETDPVKNVVVNVSPDPIPIPGNVTVSGSGSLTKDVVAPVKLQLSIKKKIVVWIPIPCVDNVGSCTYDDACEMLKEQFPGTCPAPFSTYDLPCNCPFKADSYSLPSYEMAVSATGIPSWLTSGDYQVNAKASDANGNEIACFDIGLTLN